MIGQDTSLDTSPKLCPRRRHRKWHRSPHNRFKQLKFLPETKISFIILLANAVLVRLIVVVVCVPANNSNVQGSSQQQLNQQASISISTTNHSTSNPVKQLTSLSPSEHQHQLLYLPPSNHDHNGTRPIATNNAKPARQARIYRIRAAADGKLSQPVRVAGASNDRPTNRMAKQMSSDQGPQMDSMRAAGARTSDEFGARTTQPTTVMMTSSSSIDARKSGNGSRVDGAASSHQEPINQQTTPHQRACGEPLTGSGSSTGAGTSIAATSPTLHLIVSNKHLSSMKRPLVNSQRANVSVAAQVPPSSGDQYLAPTANLSPSETASRADGSAVPSIEVDESSDPLSVIHNRQTPAAPSQVAATGSLGDYDSKMVTNRTKGKYSKRE